jgi:ribosome-associated translation inhibitor RaiA
MQVLVNTDSHIDAGSQLPAHVETVVKDALHRFGDQVTRVEAHISDASKHARPRPGEIQCTLEARLIGLEPVVVSEDADTVHQSIEGAVDKLKRALDTALGKHDSRRNASPLDHA